MLEALRRRPRSSALASGLLLAGLFSACGAGTALRAGEASTRANVRVRSFGSDRDTIVFTLDDGSTVALAMDLPAADRTLAMLVESWADGAPIRVRLRGREVIGAQGSQERAGSGPPPCLMDEGEDRPNFLRAEPVATTGNIEVAFAQHAGIYAIAGTRADVGDQVNAWFRARRERRAVGFCSSAGMQIVLR